MILIEKHRFCSNFPVESCAHDDLVAGSSRAGPTNKISDLTRHHSFSLRHRLDDLARAIDEEPGDGAERAVLKGNYSIRPAGPWQFNRHDLDIRALGEKS